MELKIKYYHSNGFNEWSNQQEWVSEKRKLKDIFGGITIEYIEKWINGEVFDVVEEVSEDEYMTFQTFSDGVLRIEFIQKYRAGGFDDAPVYRYDTDVFELSPYTL
jgi:hypothetical protein